jgi:hypothetical protein
MTVSVKMKIYEYDENSSSLIVAFNTNSSTVSIDEQPRYAYQPSVFETTDIEQFIKEVAKSGLSIAQNQDKQFNFKQNEVSVDALKSKVGLELIYSLEDLFPSTPEEDQPLEGSSF